MTYGIIYYEQFFSGKIQRRHCDVIELRIIGARYNSTAIFYDKRKNIVSPMFYGQEN